MKNTKTYDFSAGYSDKLEDLTFGDKYLDENYVHGAKTEDIPEVWITNAADSQTKH